MRTEEQLKEIVRENYSRIAGQDKTSNLSSCCGTSCCTNEPDTVMADDYSKLEGYHADADLGLGCGLPTQFAHIKKGDVVIDLGSGAGNDAFVARHQAGENGKVIGIDFTPAMISKARANAEKLGFRNVEFRQGDIENMPVSSGIADVVISNCVLNLVPNKKAVFQEIFRVLKRGGHFSISDIVLQGPLPAAIQSAAEMYAGCVAGAIQKSEYLELIEAGGFAHIEIQKDKTILIPDDILLQYLSKEAIELFKSSGVSIQSITVYGKKPETDACCETTCCNKS